MPEHHHDMARAGVYQWLSSLLTRELDDGALANLAADDSRRWLAKLGDIPELNGPVTAFIEAMDCALERPDASLELAADYASLFLVPPPAGVSLYGGDYPHTTPAGERLALRQWLVRYRCAPVDNQPADHLSIQLALMARCILHPGTPADQRAILKTHLQPWVGLLDHAASLNSISGFYPALLSLVHAWVVQDSRWLPPSEGE